MVRHGDDDDDDDNDDDDDVAVWETVSRWRECSPAVHVHECCHLLNCRGLFGLRQGLAWSAKRGDYCELLGAGVFWTAAASSCGHSGHVTVRPVIKDTRGLSFFVTWFEEVDKQSSQFGCNSDKDFEKVGMGGKHSEYCLMILLLCGIRWEQWIYSGKTRQVYGIKGENLQ